MFRPSRRIARASKEEELHGRFGKKIKAERILKVFNYDYCNKY